MKILQIIPSLSGGGAERFTVDLSNELSAKNDVSLITLYDSNDSDLFRKELNDSINTYSLGKKLGFDYKIFLLLYQEIKRINPDIIHTHLRSLNYLIPLIPFLGDTQIVHTVHNDAFKECPHKLLRNFRKLFFAQKNFKPVTISAESQTSFQLAYPNIDNSLIYNGRSFPKPSTTFHQAKKFIQSVRINEKTKVFLHIGRLEKQKNHILLIKSFNRFLVNHENAVLIMIGGTRSSDKDNMILNFVRESCNERIKWIGEGEAATDYLLLADFFCLSSLFEGMPITLIEAFAMGITPICTPVGGIPEMMKDLDSSLMAKKVDVEDYYQALKNAYEMTNERRKALEQIAMQLYKDKYSITICGKNYENLYRTSLYD